MTEKSIAFVSAQMNGLVETALRVGDGWVTLTQSPDVARWLAEELISAADRAEGRKIMEKFKGGSDE